MKLILIRHSKTVLNKEVPNQQWILSPEGILLAQKLSENQDIKKCAVIYSSFQTKAIDTALQIAKPNFIPIKCCEELTETTSLTNGWFDNYEAEMGKWHKDNYRINNGETKTESLNRIKKCINKILLKEKGADYIGIVSHGNVLSIFSEIFSDKKSIDIHGTIQMPGYAILDFEGKHFEKWWGVN